MTNPVPVAVYGVGGILETVEEHISPVHTAATGGFNINHGWPHGFNNIGDTSAARQRGLNYIAVGSIGHLICQQAGETPAADQEAQQGHQDVFYH